MLKKIDNTCPYSFENKFLLGLICIFFILFFIPIINRSLWIDETVTYWVVKDGFWDLVYRAVHYQGQSPFYYFIVWSFIQILGNAEWVLRLPSLLSLILACFFLYQLCLVLFDREWSLISVLCLICLLQVTSVGGDARSYGLALMLSILSILCFIKWIQTGRTKYQTAYIISSTATCFTHILFAPILFIHFCYYFIFKEDYTKVSLKKIVLTFAIVAGCLLPNAYQLMLLIEKRELLSFAPMPGIIDLLNAWFPIKIFLLLIAGFVISYIIQRRINIKIGRIRSKSFLFILIWFFFPAFLLFIISKVSGSSIFVNRYICWSYPAIAIVVAGLLRTIDNSASRLIAILIFPIVLILSNIVYYPTPMVEDWKGATGYINRSDIAKSTPIIVWPGLIESRNEKWSDDHEKREYLIAPFSYYTLQRKVILLPWLPRGLKLETFLFNQHAEFTKGRNELCLVVRNYLIFKDKKQKKIYIQEVLEDWLRSQGFSLIEKKSFGTIIVSRFY